MCIRDRHQILRNLYQDMMPLCSQMTGVAKGIAGLGALFYVAYRVWPVSYTHLDVYKRQAYGFAELQREKIYVLDQGKSLMLALSQDLSQNRPAEAREHVRRFHELFFTLSPEKSAIEHNVKRCLLYTSRCV